MSLFQNSAMAHSGGPSPRELALLEPWRGQIPDRVFTEPFHHPASDGYGFSRKGTERALDRVLLWNFYFIPRPSTRGLRLTYWDRFGEVRNDELSWVPYVNAWWWDERKAARVRAGVASLED